MRNRTPFVCEEKSEADILAPIGTDKADNPRSHPPMSWCEGPTRYAWIGAGQCGGRLAKSFHNLGYLNVLALNTTGHDLDLLDLPQSKKFLVGAGQEKQSATEPRTISQTIKKNRQDILHCARRTFGNNINRIMICFGAGGNVGSESVIELIEIAKRYALHIGIKDPGKNVGVLMTLPNSGETHYPQIARNACAVGTKLCQMAEGGEISPLIIVDNNKVDEMHSGMTIQSFWSSINSTVAGLFDMFYRLSSLSSPYTCFDPADYDSIMSSGGCLVMGAAKVDRLDDPLAISKAAENSLQTTLFAGGEDLSTAKVAGCVVVGGYELMAYVKGLQDNIDYAFDVMSEVTGRATAYRGIFEDDRDGLSVYTIIGGLDIPKTRLQEMAVYSCSQPEIVQNSQNPQVAILASAKRFLYEQNDAHGGQAKTLSPDTKTLIVNYSWPGGSIELADAMKHAYKVTRGYQIPPEALPYEIIFADTELYSKQVLPILEKVKLRMVSKEYDEFLRRLQR
jgi:cell division GTPase FtsZ